MTLHPHPLTILAPERAPAQLTRLAEKFALLGQLGVEHAIVLHCAPALLALDANDFLASLVAHCHPRALVEGPDFNFGRGRSGNINTLREHAAAWGYEVHVVPAVHCTELATHPTISSTSIRQALLDGRVDDANIMLGRPYRIVGTTAHGDGRGATLGFPTANLEHIPNLVPQDAVYAAIVQLQTGALHLAAVNIGPQPTFAQDRSRVEAHVLDYADDLRGQRLGLHFIARLREQQKFTDPQSLIDQIRRDVAATRALSKRVAELHSTRPIPL